MPLSKEQEDQAIEILAPVKFHRVFTAPATATRGPLRASYAIAGVDVGEKEDDVPTILFISGMMGTRYQALSLDYLAEKEGVRVLFLDRSVWFWLSRTIRRSNA
jgi:pimeloyl-ACP methyl ester carboxylesterase